MSIFVPPPPMIIHETEHWRVNHRVECRLPGYLMMAPKDPGAISLARLSAGAQAELGPLLARVEQAVAESLEPERVYIGRYGHTPGHNFHFHIIPVYAWVTTMAEADARYRMLRTLRSADDQEGDFDGGEMTLFIWREFAEKNELPVLGPTVGDAVAQLRAAIAPSR